MTTLTSNSRYRDILGPSPLPRKSRPNMSVIVMQQPQVAAAAAASSNSTANLVPESEIEPQFDGSEEWLLPLLAKEYIEDHDVEWRDLDYSSDVGPPPTSFCLFICQYDCRIFPDRMTERYVHWLLSSCDLEVQSNAAWLLINCAAQGKEKGKLELTDLHLLFLQIKNVAVAMPKICMKRNICRNSHATFGDVKASDCYSAVDCNKWLREVPFEEGILVE